ncbi:NAD(P)/FAD-dependent oxidoreductase [Pelomonas sp. Root1237]|uniref:NAD(P)/FAD-dependent oxidoreductase n=1 Tax=Pelomonas sp. Root1237 TaxID=1736434 RepID=UPI0006FE6150|nr:NAD(P)/FAD-dependent oxidoreductase [Pelomonas sp. Root1237]KQV91836.1 thioredoxin reductase [Pelomonas sp. Root1237]
MMFDALIVGGSFAGLSAALQLARARRRIAVVDAGQRRNRFVDASHGFLGQDGRPPGDIVAAAKAQLLAYPNVSWRDGLAAAARKQGEDFEVEVGGDTLRAHRLVLATGVVDELPAVEGLAERWGRTVFHCPYCHGYELAQGAIGVLASSALSMHHALMLPDWGPTTFFLNAAFEPDAEQASALVARGVAVESVPIARITGAMTVELVDGRRLPLAGLFTATRTRMASPLAEQLGCEFEQGAAGPFLRRSMFETSVRGVFACGDAASPFGNVATAVGDGAMSGAAAHRSLISGL